MKGAKKQFSYNLGAILLLLKFYKTKLQILKGLFYIFPKGRSIRICDFFLLYLFPTIQIKVLTVQTLNQLLRTFFFLKKKKPSL